MTAVTFEQVSKDWGTATALQPSDMTLTEGQFSVLLGPSGCGKTTTLRLIAGLESASTGRISIFGQDVTHVPPSHRGVSMVFQNYALFPHLSVAENIVFGLKVRSISRSIIEDRLKKTLDLLGLTPYQARKPGQLSGGQQQRVALARALVGDARLCLMDEPLSNLDAQLRQEMRHELRALQQKLGLSVVYVTHDQTEAMSMADRVVLLKSGRIEQVATPYEIYQKPCSSFVAQFIGSSKMNILELDRGCIAGTEITMHGPQSAVSVGMRPEDIQLGGPHMLVVSHSEFTGADLMVHARAGEQMIAVRAQGKQVVAPNTQIQLGWEHANLHWFDVNGLRIA